MFGQGGGTSFYRCPGTGCPIWEAAGGEYEDKAMFCIDCNDCNGKPPLKQGESSPEDVQKRVVYRIGSLIRQQNAGFLDIDSLDYWEWRLIEIWRQTEIEIERSHKAKISAIFEALLRQSNTK